MKKTTITLFLLLYLFTGTAWTQVSTLLENDQLVIRQDGLGVDATIFDINQARLVGPSDLKTNTIGVGLTQMVDAQTMGILKLLLITPSNFSKSNGSNFLTIQEGVVAIGVTAQHNTEIRFYPDDMQVGINYDDTNTENTFMLFDGSNSNIGINMMPGIDPLAFLHVQQDGAVLGAGLAMENDGDGNDIYAWDISTNDLFLRYDGDGPGGTNLSDIASINAADGTWNPLSDKRLKKDISYLGDDVLEKVLQFEPVNYRFKHTVGDVPKTFGFIAQQIEEIYPELVKFKEDGTYALNYDEFAVVSIKAIQERQQLYEEQETAIASIELQNKNLEKTLADLKEKLERLEATKGKMQQSSSSNAQNLGLVSPKIDKARLAQNSPNPFSKQTTIRYYLPDNFQSAQIQIIDNQGRIVKEQRLETQGQGEWTLEAKTLAAGTYTYTLIIDGQMINTKTMVLTK